MYCQGNNNGSISWRVNVQRLGTSIVASKISLVVIRHVRMLRFALLSNDTGARSVAGL